MELLRQMLFANIAAMVLFIAFHFLRTGIKEWGKGGWPRRVLSACINFTCSGWFFYLAFTHGRSIFIAPEGIEWWAYIIFGVITLGLDVGWVIWIRRWFKKNKHKIIDWHRRGNRICRPQSKEEGSYKAYF